MIIGVELSASITIPLSEELTLESVSPIMSQLAILPLVAVTFPSIFAALAVIVPSCFTLNFYVLMNIYLGSSTPPSNGLPLMNRSLLNKEELPIVNPPINPALADIEP